MIASQATTSRQRLRLVASAQQHGIGTSNFTQVSVDSGLKGSNQYATGQL